MFLVKVPRQLLWITAVFLLIVSSTSFAGKKRANAINELITSYETNHSFEIPAEGRIEVAFSPNEGGEALVVKVIESSKQELRILSYSFTSAPVTQAVLRAKKRGVNVILVADQKNNTSQDRSGKARAALSALVNAGIDVRLISVFPIHHDKIVISDSNTVELGSFNYSDAAARKNSENVFVNWNNPKLAQVYLGHFERNYKLSHPYSTAY